MPLYRQVIFLVLILPVCFVFPDQGNQLGQPSRYSNQLGLVKILVRRAPEFLPTACRNEEAGCQARFSQVVERLRWDVALVPDDIERSVLQVCRLSSDSRDYMPLRDPVGLCS